MNFDTNDLAIVNNDLAMATDTTAIQQAWQQKLQLWFQEWFLDTTKGVPYRQQILIKNPNLDVIQGVLINQSTSVPGIQEIQDFSFEYGSTNRSLSVFMDALDSNGQVIQAQASVALPNNVTIEGSPT